MVYSCSAEAVITQACFCWTLTWLQAPRMMAATREIVLVVCRQADAAQ